VIVVTKEQNPFSNSGRSGGRGADGEECGVTFVMNHEPIAPDTTMR
jgi:hypothetical protein